MSEIEQQFDYDCNESAGMLKLLAVLSIILGPLTLWMTFQAGDSSDGLLLLGKSWFAFVPAPLVPWVTRVFSVLLVWGGWLMFKGASKQTKFAGRVAFTPTGMIWEAGPLAGGNNEIKYHQISKLRLSEKKRGKTITFKRAGVGKCYIASWQMRSMEEFDEMAAILTNRVNGAETTGIVAP